MPRFRRALAATALAAALGLAAHPASASIEEFANFDVLTQEEDDESLLDTALREADEEIGVAPADVRYLGALSPIVTVTDFYVEPFVGAIPQPYAFRPAEAEIAEVIEVPVAALLQPGVLERRALAGRDEPVLFYHHGAHVIWGATARILKELLDAISS